MKAARSSPVLYAEYDEEAVDEGVAAGRDDDVLEWPGLS